MRLSKALKEKLYDVRLRDKSLTEGKLSKEELEKLLNALPDEASNLLYTDKIEETARTPEVQ